ncbi:MAG: hypothetical protein KBT04_03905 [Bacteroidales bacterium]|nr:hypothetical protein [Candidatus Colimorpha onthohippi]
MFCLAVAGMFAFAACNNNATEEAVVDSPVVEEVMVEEPVADTLPVEEAAAEVQTEAQAQ